MSKKLYMGQPTFEPRHWQNVAHKLWASKMQGIVEVVTGGGKTVFAELCMISFWQNYRDGRVNIIVPTIALLDQWYVSLREDLNIAADDIVCFLGGSHPKKPAKINLHVLNTARITARPISTRFDCFLIVDECHHAASPSNKHALDGFYKATLGLSATPKREYDQGLEQILIPCLGSVIFQYDYIQARKDGIIVPFDLINVSTELLPHERREYDKFSKTIARTIQMSNVKDSNRYREKLKQLLQKRAIIASSAANRIPVALRLLDNHRGQRAIIFHERIEAAAKIYQLLVERHYNAALYHSQMNPSVRQDNLRLYRRGIFDVLVTCRALDEGINLPETTVAIISSSTASTRQRIQRLGRVLRPAIGKEKAIIYTIYATTVEEERLIEEATHISEAASVQWKRSSFQLPSMNVC